MIIDLDQAVRRYGLRMQRALHIGAHHGQEDEVYARLGIEPIYVEANPEAFAVLQKTLPGRACHNVAIANRRGSIKLRVTSFDQSSSILKLAKHREIYPDIREVRVVRVPCTTIDRLMKEVGGTVELINIDIQGAELIAFRGGKRTLRGVQAVITEVNREQLYKGCALIEQIDEFLGRFGLVRVETEFTYHPSWGDALYVRQ